jgi:hypothetical protein
MKIKFRINLTREHMRFIKFYSQGELLPLFFLPVRRRNNDMVTECWFFLLAPFACIYYLIINLFWCFWGDIFLMLNNIIEWAEAKKRIIKKRKGK